MDLHTLLETPTSAEVDPKLKKWFYPIIVLLACLPRTGGLPYKTRRDIDQPPSPTSSPEQIFYDFVSKLAFLCWTDVSPATISACAVLACPDDTVEYAFTFNSRKRSELTQLEDKIKSILVMFHDSPSSDERKKEILHKVLSVCAGRVRGYLRACEVHLNGCLQACVRDDSSDAKDIRESLQPLLNATREALATSGHGGQIDIGATERLIWSLHRTYKSPVFELVQRRVLVKERQGSSEHWTELIHVAGRLMTYKQAIDVSFRVRAFWPELFQDFKITMVPSGPSASQVLNRKVMTAKEILNKTTSDESKLKELYAAVERTERLLSIKLDDEIKGGWSKKHHISLHAEINLLQYLERTEGGTDDSRFFQGIKFIGTSKPPCKLCFYFFQDYAPGIRIRATHGNTYLWLMPTLTPHQSNPRKGRDTLDVARRIRARLMDEDVLPALQGGQIDGRPHDSSNYSTRQGLRSQDRWEAMSARTHASTATRDAELDETESVGLPYHEEDFIRSPIVLSDIQAQAAVDDISRDISSLSLHSERQGEQRLRPATKDQSRGTVRKLRPSAAEIESEDDDGGGTLLFRGRLSLSVRTHRQHLKGR